MIKQRNIMSMIYCNPYSLKKNLPLMILYARWAFRLHKNHFDALIQKVKRPYQERSPYIYTFIVMKGNGQIKHTKIRTTRFSGLTIIWNALESLKNA